MKLRTFVPTIATVAALAATPAVAYAAPAPAAVSRQATAPQAKAVDIAWMKASAASDLAEIGAGKLAASKGTTAGAAGLGALFVKQHTEHLAMLKKLAAARGVTLPTAPLPKDVAIMEKMEAAPAGLTWDRNWVRQQASAHRANLIATGKARQVSRDAGVLDFERKTLAVVKGHHVALLGVWVVIAPASALTDDSSM